jgi:hypothetical protein
MGTKMGGLQSFRVGALSAGSVWGGTSSLRCQLTAGSVPSRANTIFAELVFSCCTSKWKRVPSSEASTPNS